MEASGGAEFGQEESGSARPLSQSYSSQRRDAGWDSSQYSLCTVGDGERRQPAEKTQPLLRLLRTVQSHNIIIFPLVISRYWRARGALGEGTTYSVEQFGIPPWHRHRSPYREPQFLGRGGSVYFTDHNGIKWNYDTPFAYKSLVEKRQATGEHMDDLTNSLINEVRIYCHPPMKKHPNIVQFLGITWSDEAELGNENHLRPMPVIQEATLGTLRNFLSSAEFIQSKPTLRDKLNLCIDVLHGLLALHRNGISHLDVKLDNSLVFYGDTNVVGDWIVKICDFSHSKIHPATAQSSFSWEDVQGTPLYSPPEALSRHVSLPGSTLFAIDIWCWGMLVWMTLMNGVVEKKDDGECISFENGVSVTSQELADKKRDGSLKDFAKDTCTRHLREKHRTEHHLLEPICGLLARSLQREASRRATADSLFIFATESAGLEYHLSTTEAKCYPILTNDSLPALDVTGLHYDLLSLPRVARQLLQELEEATQVDYGANIDDSDMSEAKLQLGLCRVSGLGADGVTSVESAMDLIKDAATMGNKRAETIIPFLSTAFGLNIGEDFRPGISPEQTMSLSLVSGHMGNRGQSDDRTSCVSKQRRMKREEELFFRVKEADMLGVHAILEEGADPNHLGPSGETALHYAALVLDEGTSQGIINVLLAHHADPHIRTRMPVGLMRDALLADRVPEGTSPIDWAVIYDNVAAAGVLLRQQDDSQNRQVVSENIVQACRNLSLGCLKLFLDNLPPGWIPADWEFDAHGFTAMYHALRPDLFGRILHSNICHPHTLRRRQQMVVRTLLYHNASRQMNRDGSFSAVHLLAAYGDHETMRDLLDMEEFKSQIDARSSDDLHGATPLRDAIIRGQKEPFQLLLERGARTTDVRRRGKNCHALHLCSEQPDAAIVRDFVESILERDPTSLKVKLTKNGRTALHMAAMNDNVGMVDVLLSRGSSLLETDHCSATPLGLSVAWRSVRALEKLCHAHVEQKTPLLAHRFGFMDSLFNWQEPEFAVRMLMAPGRHGFVNKETWAVGGTASHPLNETSRCTRGAVDVPFSRVSEKILTILLQHHREAGTVCFSAFGTWVHCCFIPEAHDTGLDWAVRLGNKYAVDEIARLSSCWIRWRAYLQIAVDQLAMDYRHFTPESSRIKMVDNLRVRARRQFQDLRDRRQKMPVLGLFWALYYRLYGDLEDQIQEDAVEWQMNNRYLWWRPNLFELGRWPETRYQVNIIFVWCFLIPMIAMFAKSHVDNGEYGSRGGLLAGFIILTTVLSVWPQFCRVVGISFIALWRPNNVARARGDRFDWSHRRRSVLFIFLGLISVPLALFNVWVMVKATLPLDNGSQPLDPDDHLGRASQDLGAFVVTWLVVTSYFFSVIPGFETLRSIAHKDRKLTQQRQRVRNLYVETGRRSQGYWLLFGTWGVGP